MRGRLTVRGCSNLVTVVNLVFQWIPLDIGVLIHDVKTKKISAFDPLNRLFYKVLEIFSMAGKISF